jgi:hypothetical protein
MTSKGGILLWQARDIGTIPGIATMHSVNAHHLAT